MKLTENIKLSIINSSIKYLNWKKYKKNLRMDLLFIQ